MKQNFKKQNKQKDYLKKILKKFSNFVMISGKKR